MAQETDTGSPLLRDESRYPSEEVLRQALANTYPVFAEFMAAIHGEAHGLATEWRYYKDGRTWLCKATRQKKTIAWISVWDGFFKAGFYFTEQSGSGIVTLDIDEAIKDRYASSQAVGKLKPVTVEVRERAQLADLLTLVEFRKKAK